MDGGIGGCWPPSRRVRTLSAVLLAVATLVVVLWPPSSASSDFDIPAPSTRFISSKRTPAIQGRASSGQPSSLRIEAPVSLFSPPSPIPVPPKRRQIIGALYPVYRNAASVARVLASFRRHYPKGHIVLVGDGGDDFSTICSHIGHCTWRAHTHLFSRNATYAGDAKGAAKLVSRYLSAFHDLALKGVTHALLLEDDVRVLRPFLQRFDAAITGFIPSYLLRYYPPTVDVLIRAGWKRPQARTQPYGGFGGCVYDVEFWTTKVDDTDVRMTLQSLSSLSLFASDIVLTTIALTHPRGCSPAGQRSSRRPPCGRLAQLDEYTDAHNYAREYVYQAASGRAAVVHHYKREYADSPGLDDLLMLQGSRAERPAKLSAQIVGAVYDVSASDMRRASVLRVLNSFRRHYPAGPVVLVTGKAGDKSLGRLCSSIGRCALQPRGNTAPEKVVAVIDAVTTLGSDGATHAVLLEDDVRILRPFEQRFDAALTTARWTHHFPQLLVTGLSRSGWAASEANTMRFSSLGGSVFSRSAWENASSCVAAASSKLGTPHELESVPFDALFAAITRVLQRGSGSAACSSRDLLTTGSIKSTTEIADLSTRRDFAGQASRDAAARRDENGILIVSGRAAVVDGFAAELDEKPTAAERAILEKAGYARA